MFKNFFKSRRNKLEENKKDYLSNFKKDYEDRTDAEKIVTYALYNLEVNTDDLGPKSRGRMYGSIEAVLILEGFLVVGTDFNYNKNESYAEFIIRYGKDYLKSKGVM